MRTKNKINAREQLEMHLQKRQKVFGKITLQIPFVIRRTLVDWRAVGDFCGKSMN
ncbi:hypothetical protein [Lysinibacillus sp. UGB7]|uniref:hypothetical protein n=1 Tax=Lysinibacillus TaxID=400634 RepID=UPI003B7A138E